LEIVGEDSILHEVGGMKCERALSLGDCHTLAVATKLNGTALFARAEDDLAREMKKKTFSVKLMFLESHLVPLKSLKELRGALKEHEKPLRRAFRELEKEHREEARA
jgi:hypothetical protein